MINGMHAIIYSANADADRAFLRDTLKLANVDVGGGWLIFALPPSELACHPDQANGRHELYFMVDNIQQFAREMRSRSIGCTDPADKGWGILSEITLPGGGTLGVYQPRHARPGQ